MFQKIQELLVLGTVRACSGSARPCLTLLLQQREPGVLGSAPRDSRFLSCAGQVRARRARVSLPVTQSEWPKHVLFLASLGRG